MTKEEILSCLRIKYQLSNFDKKTLRKELISDKKYEAFIKDLLLLLDAQNGYVFEIHDRLVEIIEIIDRKALKAERDFTIYEQNLMIIFDSILSKSLEYRVDFKAQYESICRSQQFPVFKMPDYSYNEIAKSNYHNFELYLQHENSFLIDELFNNEESFLILINELLSLYPKSLDDETLKQFVKIIDNSDYKDESIVKTTAYYINKKSTLKRISNMLKERKIDEEVLKKLIKK